MELTEEAKAWIRQTMGGAPQPLVFTRMQGSTSSSVYLVESGADGQTTRVVLRVLDNREWLAEEPDLAEHEAAALKETAKAGLPAPILHGFTTAEIGFGGPAVLMSFVEGRIDLRPVDFDGWIAALSQELAAIHRHPALDLHWTFRSWADKTAPPSVEWSRYPDLWNRAFDIVASGEPAYEPVFIHRDYHPMNVLWTAGRITGVVDWINACRGPACVDVAHCRTNLAGMYGPQAAEQFLQAYLSHGGQPFDPYWDLDSLIDMCLPPSLYPPWQDFGLSHLTQPLLCQRMDDHLAQILPRL